MHPATLLRWSASWVVAVTALTACTPPPSPTRESSAALEASCSCGAGVLVCSDEEEQLSVLEDAAGICAGSGGGQGRRGLCLPATGPLVSERVHVTSQEYDYAP